jgi:hypothetical protein
MFQVLLNEVKDLSCGFVTDPSKLRMRYKTRTLNLEP